MWIKLCETAVWILELLEKQNQFVIAILLENVENVVFVNVKTNLKWTYLPI